MTACNDRVVLYGPPHHKAKRDFPPTSEPQEKLPASRRKALNFLFPPRHRTILTAVFADSLVLAGTRPSSYLRGKKIELFVGRTPCRHHTQRLTSSSCASASSFLRLPGAYGESHARYLKIVNRQMISEHGWRVILEVANVSLRVKNDMESRQSKHEKQHFLVVRPPGRAR